MPNGSVGIEDRHRAFLSSIGDVRDHSDLSEKPLEAELEPPLPSKIRVYIYTVTKAGGSRPDDEYNIQVILSGHDRGEEKSLDTSDERVAILAGYYEPLDVFVLWDQSLHDEFSFSETVQVKLDTLQEAADEGISTQIRHLAAGEETVIAGHSDSLERALMRRVGLGIDSSTEGATPSERSESEVKERRAVDYENPDEKTVETTRVVRDTGIVEQLKEAYQHRCQVCGEQRMKGPDEYYSEGHHLKPLSDGGPDDPANILVLCPNHHTDFDYGMIKIDPGSLDINHAYEDDRDLTLEVHNEHEIDPGFIAYNNETVADF